jgi:hypothetical protein
MREAQLVDDLRKLDLGRSEMSAQGTADLALERGDRGAAAAMGKVGVEIVENTVTRAATAPSLDAEDLDGKLATMHLTMEGHRPNFGISQLRHHQENPKDHRDSDDDTGMDWI